MLTYEGFGEGKEEQAFRLLREVEARREAEPGRLPCVANNLYLV